jgi:hypothetical protein
VTFRTIEVDVIDGRVKPTGSDELPDRARALLTVIEEAPKNGACAELLGLKRFLELPHIPVTAEQIRKSLEEDYYDQ